VLVVRRRRVPDEPAARAEWYLRSEDSDPNGHRPCGAPDCPACRTALAAWEAVWARYPNRGDDRVGQETRALIRAAYLPATDSTGAPAG
jgi:hypothetical protein